MPYIAWLQLLGYGPSCLWGFMFLTRASARFYQAAWGQTPDPWAAIWLSLSTSCCPQLPELSPFYGLIPSPTQEEHLP